MALIFATAVVAALVIAPEAQHVDTGGGRGALPIAHEFRPRSSALQVIAALPELQAPRYTEELPGGDGSNDSLRAGKPPEWLQPREPYPLLPALRRAPLAGVAAPGSGAAEVLAALRQCESGGDYAINTGNGYYGAYQFLPSTWASVGGVGRPDLASPAEQDYRAALMLEAGRRGEWGC